MSSELVVHDSSTLAPVAAPQLLDALRPAERVALMAEVSSVVKDVIEKQKWFTDIKGKKHIRIEGWTFIGGLGACSAKTTHVEQIDGGWKAHAVVVRVDTGIEVGSAEQVCMKTESFGKGKADQALIGMASTRACSRALSTVFRHVVELAGYSATPSEEMLDVTPQATRRAETVASEPTIEELHDEIYGMLVSLNLPPERAAAAVEWASSGRTVDHTQLDADEAHGLIGKLRSMKVQQQHAGAA